MEDVLVLAYVTTSYGMRASLYSCVLCYFDIFFIMGVILSIRYKEVVHEHRI